MSSKNHKIAPAKDVVQAAPAATPAVAAEPKAPVVRSRGPRGTEETAKITLLAKDNPKRAGSKAFGAFANYKDGMTIKEFADLVGKEATGHLVYDAKHGSIAIEGYDPGAIVVPKPKVVKEPKAKKEKAPKDATAAAHKDGLESETKNESMD